MVSKFYSAILLNFIKFLVKDIREILRALDVGGTEKKKEARAINKKVFSHELADDSKLIYQMIS